ncbi:hypothetical protein GUITHDRAFT_122485 [Guillardia theta CCMP2712]|uniref:Uncharacterized protein n=1 Tax=Guillardia theta (strain CCMP2712) TaxID=905079 RepID=L1I652_GUITC|nr:hypothetical protein GUITHDRAFT_122485 [Guillardia theta CCMP2712]EKX31320.1 hypothetical protein GUITHDRAFT_122485 [Guillardia theta CCMP2712]|eukprot:XP_005818300.1 hypothetical protein GUITHDRAFT_122485 [Guillardia theta CCMP2712]
MTDVRHADEKKLSERLHAALHDILSSSEPQGILKIYSGKTYLDMSCLPAPDEQETTGSRARYLWSCSVFVPVISWGKGGSVLEQLGRINEEHDYVSDFLVHALTALYLLNKDAGRLKAVLPILRDESGGKTSMSSAFDRLSHKASMSSCERASEVLLEVGVRREKEAILQYLLGVSVRDAVAMLLPAVRGAQGVQEEERGRRSKGVYGMYVAAENDVERSAVEAGELIVACLSKIVREHVDRKLWEFSNHNPRGIEVLQVLRESGLHDRFFEFFALRGIETIHKVSKHTKTSFMHRRCGAVTRSCDEVLAALQHHDESSVRTLEKLVEDYREDERFLPLNERLRRYRDSDVHGVLALRTSNSLETALVKLPARSCVVFLSLVYLVFGVKQLGLLGTDQLWLPHTNSSTPVSPRVVRISTVADPIISFTWSFLFLSGIVLSLFSTPLQGKRLLLATGHLVIAGNVMCVVADALQCSREGTGIGSVCNSNMKVVAIVLLMLIMYLAHFVQHYFWLSAFFMQGAYCLLVSASVSHVAELSIFLLLGLGCWAVGLLIVVKYHLAYRKTFRELKVAMLGFEETWRGVMREKARAVEEISVLARAIAEELEEKVREDTKTWGRLLCVTLGLKERRYSRRNGKIRQASRDFEQLFLQAQEVSAAFQLWVSGWNRVGRVEHGATPRA